MNFIGGFGVSKTVIRSLLAAAILLSSFGTAIAEPTPPSNEKAPKGGDKAAADKAAGQSAERKPASANKTGDSDSSAKSSDAKPDAEPGPLPELFELAAELQAMVDEDQKARTVLIQKMAAAPGEKGAGATAGGEKGAGEKSVPATSEVLAAIESVRFIDEKNTTRLKEIVAAHGWPGISKLGKAGSGNMWLLVQHADQQVEFQKQCLELMTPLLERREVSRQNFAYLMDRVLVNTGKPQRYGTQINMKGTEFVPAEVESPEELDARRKDMDLGPMSEYLEQVKAAYGNTAKPPDDAKPDDKPSKKPSDKPSNKP